MGFNSAFKGLIVHKLDNKIFLFRWCKYEDDQFIIIIISNLSNDRSKASSKTIPPHSAI